MPLFRKQPSGPDGPLGDLFETIGLPATREREGWAAPIGPTVLYMSWIDKGRVLSGFAPLADAEGAAELRDLLHRNLEPRLTWFSRGGTGEDGGLGARFAVPLDPFDPGAVRLAVEALARTLGADDVADRARRPTGGERAEQAAESGAREALEAALGAARLQATADDEHAGVWRVEAGGRALDAVLRDTGESVLLMHQLEYAAGDEDPEVLRWLLLASDWGSARLGMADLPGGPGLFAAAVVATTSAEPPVAWGVEQVLELAREYDRRSGG